MDDRSNVLKDDKIAAALLNGAGSGDSLFVINLCAANVPQSIDSGSVESWGIVGLERYKLYQVSRMEDGRRRYRVRLGFFTSEADAESVLRTVRGRFATAFSSCLADEDLKHASGYLRKPLHEIQEIQDLQRTGRFRIPKFPESQHNDPRPAAAAKAIPLSQPIKNSRPASSLPLASGRERPKENGLVEIEWSPPAKAGPQTKVRAATSAKLAAYISSSKPAPAAIKPVATVSSHKPAPITHATKSMAPKTPGDRFHVSGGREIPAHGFELVDDAAGFKPSAVQPAK
jgi:hypothetical protein